MNQQSVATINKIDKIFEAEFGKDISENLISTFTDSLNEYNLRKWPDVIILGGHFVEAARRVIELELFGSHTPFSQSLSLFDERTIANYANAPKMHESHRLIIPRVLYTIYTIRNKRGAGHIGELKPNYMDATFVLNAMKWCVAELFRIKSKLSADETQRLIDSIIIKNISLIWNTGKTDVVLDPKMPAKNQLLILLLQRDELSEEELRFAIEYKNSTVFKRNVILPLHKKRLIIYDDKKCKITPLGTEEAEKILLQH